VYIQDQHGKTPKRWNKSGIILEVEPYDSYLVKVDGSGKVTKRNRQFLRRFEPFSAEPRTPTTLPPIPPAAHLASPPPMPAKPQPAPTAPVTPQLPPDVPDISLPMDQHVTSATCPPHPVDTISAPKPTIPKHLRERWVVNPNLTSYQPTTHSSTVPDLPNQALSLASLAAANCFPVFPITPFHLSQPAQMSLMYSNPYHTMSYPNTQLSYLPYAVPDAY
jgi:hypothetical protein